MKFTKEVSVCIVAAALSLMTDSSLDTSTYMASSLKLKLSVTSDAEPSKNYFYSHPEATRKCREELVQNASSFETTYEKIEIQGINQNASSFERCVEFYKRQVYNEVEEEDNRSVTSSGSEALSSSMQSQVSTPTTPSSMRSRVPSGEIIKSRAAKAKAFSSAVAGGAQLARSVERGATVAAVRAANAVITAADRYDKWESNRAQARINRNYNREVDRRIRKVQVTMGIRNAPREPWHKRNPHTAFILGVMSAVAVCGGVSFLIAVLIVAKGGPIIRPSLMEETGP